MPPSPAAAHADTTLSSPLLYKESFLFYYQIVKILAFHVPIQMYLHSLRVKSYKRVPKYESCIIGGREMRIKALPSFEPLAQHLHNRCLHRPSSSRP